MVFKICHCVASLNQRSPTGKKNNSTNGKHYYQRPTHPCPALARGRGMSAQTAAHPLPQSASQSFNTPLPKFLPKKRSEESLGGGELLFGLSHQLHCFLLRVSHGGGCGECVKVRASPSQVTQLLVCLSSIQVYIMLLCPRLTLLDPSYIPSLSHPEDSI